MLRPVAMTGDLANGAQRCSG